MLLNFDELESIYSEQLYAKLSQEEQEEAWRKSQRYSNPVARCNAYLGYLCLNAFVEWIQERFEGIQAEDENGENQPLVQPSIEDLSSVWEFVNGIPVYLGKTQFVLIPTQTSEPDELIVPKEWVEIPEWVADYYLAVQVNLDDAEDDCWMRIWGFTNHLELMNKGEFDESDRTYSLAREDLLEDLTVLWGTLGIQLRKEIKPLPTQSEADIKESLQQLNKVALHSPRLRLEMPFEQWASLMTNHEWREELYLRRIGQWSPLPPLNQWFNVNDIKVIEALISAGWQRDLEVFDKQEAVALARRFKSDYQNNSISWVKRIDSKLQLADYPIALIIRLTQADYQTIWILPELHPIAPINIDICLPKGLTLIVLNQSGEIFDQIRAGTADNFINLDEEFTDSLGSRFSIRVTLEQVEVVTINFVI